MKSFPITVIVVLLTILISHTTSRSQELLQVNEDNKIFVKKDYQFDNTLQNDLFELVQYWFEETLVQDYDSIRSVDTEVGEMTGVISTLYPVRNNDEIFLNFIKISTYDNYISIYMDDMRTYYGDTPLEQYVLKTDGKFRDPDMVYEVEGELIVLLNGIRNFIEDNKF